MIKITKTDFEEILGFKLDEQTIKQIEKFELCYRELSKSERDNYISDVVNVLTNPIVVSGKHRINDWELGWGENLTTFEKTKDINTLIPKYHGKNRIVRWKGDVIMPLTENFDYKIHICFVDAILRHYFSDFQEIFEFGCGPAYHLLRLSNYNKDYKLYGSDWATSSQKIISQINETFDCKIVGFNLDFFSPLCEYNMNSSTGIYTVAALEQVGENFKNFINLLIEKKPGLCVHMEPIDELLDNNSLIDNLSIKYFRKRNYLDKFLPYLEELEEQGKIKIEKKQRIFSGSYFIEGHSLIVWKPI